MSGFLTLKCPSCGGTLFLAGDADRLICIHCGRESVVTRSGSAVCLERGNQAEPGPQPAMIEPTSEPAFQPPEDASAAPEMPTAEAAVIPAAPEDVAALPSQERQGAEAGVDEAESDPTVQRLRAEIEELQLRRADAQERLDALGSAASPQPDGAWQAAVLLAVSVTLGLIMFVAIVFPSVADTSREVTSLCPAVLFLFGILASIIVRGVMAVAASPGRMVHNHSSAEDRSDLRNTILFLDAQLEGKNAELQHHRRASPRP